MAARADGTDLEALLARMTLDEKVGQLTMRTANMAVTGPVGPGEYLDGVRAGRIGSMLNLWGARWVREAQTAAVEQSRLGIPLFFGFDVVHGHRTTFPIPLGEAAAFDPGLCNRTARPAAVEAAADGLSLTFAPMLDVARDARWGRGAESPGEDTWLAARFAEAKVRGFQGAGLAAPDAVAATPKHLAGYGAVLAGREYAPVDMSERTLREVHLPPFRAAVTAGAAAIMPAFTDIAGLPMTANRPLLHDTVRGEWGFDGVFISDYNAVAELIHHGVAGDLAEAAALALNAGIDIDMMSDAYPKGLASAVKRGLTDVATVDAAVLRVLHFKQRLGLFDNPFARGADTSPAVAAGHRALAREAARKAIVLLTNRNAVLPLAANVRRIALIGPLADAKSEMLGPWWGAGNREEAVSILDGLRAARPDADIRHVAGVAIEGGDGDDECGGIAEAVSAARAADIVVLCLGEAAAMSGEAASRADPGLPGRQGALADAVLGLNKPTVLVLSSGRPLIATDAIGRADAALATWFLGSEAGHAVADVLTGAENPSGRLPVSWPATLGQVPIFYARRPTGRPPRAEDHYSSKYLDAPVAPLFPFGHGLSYGDVTYRNLRATPDKTGLDGTIAVTVELSNDGDRAVEETVLLFVHDPVASLSRPRLELKGAVKATVPAGGAAKAALSLSVADLAFVGLDGTMRVEAGAYEICVGPSADESTLLRATITVA
jgi:beta-glucosidase